MDLFPAEPATVLFLGRSELLRSEPLVWLAEVCHLLAWSGTGADTCARGAKASHAQLVLLDADAPSASAWFAQLRMNPQTQPLPVLAMASQPRVQQEVAWLERGVLDYLTPANGRAAFVARVKNHLDQQFNTRLLRQIAAHQEREASRQMQESQAVQATLAWVLDAMSHPGDGHAHTARQRLQRHVQVLAQQLQGHPAYAAFLTRRNIELTTWAAALHDLGRASLPPALRGAQARLSDEEAALVRSHPALGRQALERIEQQQGQHLALLDIAKDIVHYQHAHWNGQGLPQGLKGTAIPPCARLVAVAHAYCTALGPWPLGDATAQAAAQEVALAQVREGRGTRFDPVAVDALLAAAPQLRSLDGAMTGAMIGAMTEAIPSSHLTTLPSLAAYASAIAPPEPPKPTAPAPVPAVPPALPTAGESLLLRLQARTERLSPEARPFVLTLLQGTTIVPSSLADLLQALLIGQSTPQPGPVHYALARMYQPIEVPPDQARQAHQANMTLIRLCQGTRAAHEALRFIQELPSLLTPASTQRAGA